MRISLLNLLLFIGAIAAWTSVWVQQRETNRFAIQLPGLREVARPLDVEDPAMLTIVKKHPEWSNQVSWLVHIPDDTPCSLNLAFDGITSSIEQKDSPMNPIQKFNLSPGKHEIEYKETPGVDESGDFLIEVLVDEIVEFSFEKPAEWKPGTGTSTSSDAGISKSFGSGRTDLMRKRHVRADGTLSGAEFSNGVLLWINH